MAIKHKIKFKGDQARGTSPAELRSSGPKQRPERVATTPGVEEVSSGRGDLPDDRPRYEEQSEEEYLRHCERFFKGWEDDSKT
jgi:hypothetical protein|tara:strand:- start:37 stop:285 length:249 start_codon:yes stop_codon:yes gene_type:complete